MNENWQETYNRGLSEAAEFQDFVAYTLLMKRGWVLNQFGSRKYQHSYGESASCIEVKLDRKYAETGNIYIETHEKAHPSNAEYVASGILRDDNTKLWVIGDYKKLFVFFKSQLRHIYESPHVILTNGIRLVQKPTSKGFLLPIKCACFEWACGDVIECA